MNSIVERPPLKQVASVQAEKIRQQAERIKELEAERDAERDNCVAVIATYQEQLAALRQRIADAPVVAEVEKERGLTYGNRGAAAVGTKLISKEDLQK